MLAAEMRHSRPAPLRWSKRRLWMTSDRQGIRRGRRHAQPTAAAWYDWSRIQKNATRLLRNSPAVPRTGPGMRLAGRDDPRIDGRSDVQKGRDVSCGGPVACVMPVVRSS